MHQFAQCLPVPFPFLMSFFRGPGMTATLTTPEEPAMHSDLRVREHNVSLKIYLYIYICVFIFSIFVFYFCMGLWCSISSLHCALARYLLRRRPNMPSPPLWPMFKFAYLSHICMFVSLCVFVKMYLILWYAIALLDWIPSAQNGIKIDLHKCVGKNVGLFQGVGSRDVREKWTSEMTCHVSHSWEMELKNQLKSTTHPSSHLDVSKTTQTHWDSSHCLTSVQPLPLRTACPMSIWCPRFGPPSWNSTRDRVCQPRRSGRIARLHILQPQFSEVANFKGSNWFLLWPLTIPASTSTWLHDCVFWCCVVHLCCHRFLSATTGLLNSDGFQLFISLGVCTDAHTKSHCRSTHFWF